jgi:uncharacterized membrane protein
VLWPPTDEQIAERARRAEGADDVTDPESLPADDPGEVPTLSPVRPPHPNERHAAGLSRLDRAALFITSIVGTMACVAVFTVISLFALPTVIHAGNLEIWVAWISSQFLQLVLLPLLMVGQNLQGRHAETRAEADFEVNQKAYADTEQILQRLASLEQQNNALLRHLSQEPDPKPRRRRG